MSRFTITTKEAGQSQVFNLKAVASAEDIIAVPAIQTGYYLIEGGEGNQLSEGLSLSRHNDALHIHIDDSAAPSAIIPEYYNSPALLTIPASNNQLQALDMAQVQTEHAPVALSLLADAGDTPYTPGGPGIIIADGATDDSADGSTKEIGNHEGTADLTPELHGTAFGAEEMILTIYANTQVLGTVIVGDDGTWSFTPDEGALSYGSNYIFMAVLEDSSTNALFIAMPFTVSETVDGQAAADLPNTGDDGIVLIDHLVDANGIHQGDVANNGITDDLNPVIQGTLFGGEEMTISIYANTQFIGTAIVQEDGTWSYDLSGLEDHAQYTIVAILTDSSSDAKFVSLPFVFTTGFDEQVPVITSVHDDAGTVKGDLTDGQPTDDTTPTISGTADPDAIVNIYDGSTLLGSAQVDGSGHWTFTPDTPLSGDGDHFISVTATDGTDESAHSADFDVNLDTVCEKPVITDIQDDVGKVTGNVLDNGNITDDGNVVISGTSEPGSSLTLFFTGVDNSIQSLDLTPNADGTWSIPSDYMEQKGDGTYNYWLTSVDAAGNKSNSDIVTVTYKTAPPDASTNEQLTDDVEPKTGPILNGDTTDDSTPTYQGDAEAKDVVIISDNGEVIGSVVADDKGHWTFTPDTPLNDGDHSFSTVVVDGNGKQSDPSAPIGFTVDTAVPDPIDINSPDNLVVYDDIAPITGDIPQDGVTNDTMPTFSGTTPALAKGEVVTIYSDGEVLGSAIVGDGGAWNFTPSSPMAEGPHEIELTVTNAAGAESDKSLPFDFTIDTIAPVAPTITDVVDDEQNIDVAPNGSTSDTTPQIQGTGEAEGDIITVYSNGAAIGSAVVGADGTWTFTPDALADGTYDITVTETDAAGNVSAPSNAYDFTVDTIAPAAPVITDVVDDSGTQNIDVAQNGSTNDSTPQIQGTGEANGDIITVYNGDEVLGSAVVGADGSWTFTPDALADGTYDITVTETDAAGNVSDPSNAYDFTINTVAPEAPVITDVVDDSGEQNVDVAPNGATNDNTPQIQGTGNAEGDVITVYNGSHVLGSAVVDADGSWTFTPDALADGLYDITVTETDAAGNVSDPSAAYDFTIDTVAPAAPVITDVVDDSSEQPVDVAQNGFTNDTTPQIQGTGNAEGDIITVYNGDEVLGSAMVDANGSWTFTPDVLADGKYDITVTETDAAGNESVPSNAYDFTVDTVAPAAPVITDVVDDSSAQPVDVAPNGSTNDTTPQIQGTGNAEGDIITVYNGDEVLGSAVVGADGSWTFTPDALADGLYDITVTETDAAGNESAPSNAYDFTINTVAPVTPVITDVVDDSGEQNVDVAPNGSTSDTTPQIQGTGEAEGDIITVYNNGAAIGSAVVDADGTWTFTPDALADGKYDITVTETDAAGNVSEASNAYDFTIDTVAPVAPVITDVVDDSAEQPVDVAQNGSTNDTTPQIQGTGEAEGDIITVYNGSEVLGSAMVGADGTWTFTPDALADGKYDITVTETDAAGNVSAPSNAYDFTIDTVAPVTPVITDVVDDSAGQPVDVAQNGSTNDTTPQIQGTGEAEGDIITVYNGDEVLGSAVVGADGSWTFTPDALADGQYDITVTETDAAGNESAPSNAYDFTVNTVAPVTPVITDVVDDSGEQNVDVAPNGSTSDTTPQIQGTGEAEGDIITVYNGSEVLGTAMVGADGSWTFTPDALADGKYDITVTETDAAGNVSEASNAYDFTIDTVAPVAPVITDVVDDSGEQNVDVAPNGSTSDTTPQIQGTGEAEGDIITVYNGSEVLGSAMVGADGSWTFTPDALADGKYDITVTETDAAGNVSEASNAYDFTIDTVAPVAPVITDVVDDSGEQNVDVAQNGSTSDTTPQIQGTGEAEGDIITVYNNGAAIGSAVVGADGSWTFTPDALADGQYDITVTETDAAGNVSEASNAYDFTVDTIAPVAPVITDVVDDSAGQPVDVAQNGSTNDTTPQIQGTGEAEGDIITVYNGSEVLGTAMVGADGSWTFTPDALADGKYDITVTETDAAGNVSAPSNAYDFTIDTVAPVTPVITDVVDDSGTQNIDVAQNGSTSDTTPQIQGTGEAEGDIITVYNGSEVLGTAMVGADGSWTFTPDALADGKYDITVTETDAAGNVSEASNAYDFTIDTVAPVAPVITDVVDDSAGQPVDVAQNGLTSDNTPQIQGTGEAEGDIITVYNNGTAIGSAVVGADGTWTFTPDVLADGKYDITVTETDAAGNESAPSNAYDFTVDTVAPVAPVITDVVDDSSAQPVDVAQNGFTSDNTPVINGTGEADGDIITVYNNGAAIGSAVVGADGTWSFTPDALDEGHYDITVTETDAAGNVSAPSNAYDFTVDTVAPVAPTITDVVDDAGEQNVDVAPNGFTSDNTPVINGTGETDGDIITVYNNGAAIGSAVVGADGTWSFTPAVALADGTYDITVTEADAAGNVSDPSAAYDFTIDTIAPGAPTLTEIDDNVGTQTGPIAQDGTTDDSAPVFKGTGETDGDIITIYNGSDVLGTAVVGADGSWTFTPSAALDDGQYDITVTETDKAGNESGSTPPFDFTVSTNVPDAATGIDVRDDEGDEQGVVVPGGATDDATPVIEGDATAGDVVIISDNGVVIGSTTVDPDGTWHFTPDAPLDTGSHSIDTVVVDPETGSKSAPSEPVDFSVIAKGSTSFENVEGFKNILSDTPFNNPDAKDGLGLGGLSVTLLKPGYEVTGSESEIGTKGVVLFAPKSFGKVDMELSGTSQTRLDFGGQTNMVSFDVAAVTATGTVVHYFDVNGNEIGSMDVPVTDPHDTRAIENISFEAPAGTLIDHVEIDVGPESSSGTIRVDNITWGETQYEAAAAPQAEAAHTDVALMALATQAHPAEHDATTATASTHDAPQNHLTLSLDDVLSQGADNAFIADGKEQFAVTGNAGDHVDLTGVSDSSLAHTGNVTSGGVAYDVYSVAGSDTELLVQHGVELHAMA